jgi:hypothetical protein
VTPQRRSITVRLDPRTRKHSKHRVKQDGRFCSRVECALAPLLTEARPVVSGGWTRLRIGIRLDTMPYLWRASSGESRGKRAGGVGSEEGEEEGGGGRPVELDGGAVHVHLHLRGEGGREMRERERDGRREM